MVQHKDDIVCAFHGDIETQLGELNDWMKSIDKKLGKLLLWKAGVIGWASGATFVVIIVFKLIGFIK
jgi:hypothetical protein